MRVRLALLSAVTCAGLTALAAWAYGWSFERAVLLSPAVMLVFGLGAGLVVLWTRIVWESVRRRR